MVSAGELGRKGIGRKGMSAEKLKRLKGKKAVIEVQFHWIFILIAGAVFLLFFLSVLNSQKKAADKVLDAELIKKIDTLVTGSASTFESFKEVLIPEISLEFTCDAEGRSSLELGSFSQPTPIQTIYSRPSMKTGKLYLFTDRHSAGFPVAPVLYVSSPTIRYVFVNSTLPEESKAISAAFSSFPNSTAIMVNGQKGLDSLQQDVDENIIVAIGSGIIRPSSFSRQSTSIVRVTPPNIAEIEKYPSGISITYYVGNAMLKGLIVSADKEFYECNSRKLLTRQALLSRLYLNRSLMLNASPAMAQDCKDIYSGIMETLPALESSRNMTLSNFTKIAKASTTLLRLNEDLLRGTRCPLLI